MLRGLGWLSGVRVRVGRGSGEGGGYALFSFFSSVYSTSTFAHAYHTTKQNKKPPPLDTPFIPRVVSACIMMVDGTRVK